MRKQFLIGLLFAFLIGLQANIMPEKPPGVKSDIAIEQSDILQPNFDFNLWDNPVMINEAEVEISPGLNYGVFITFTEIESRTLESNEMRFNIDKGSLLYYESVQAILFKRRKNKLKNNYMLNHKLYEISPGDNLG